MAKIRLINTTKINGSFVEGGTVLEIGTDISKEEAKNLKNQNIAEDFLSIKEIEEVKVEQTSLIETLTAEKADLEKQLEIEKAQNKTLTAEKADLEKQLEIEKAQNKTLTAEKADLEKKIKALEKPEK